jgi:hypothetical protein
MKALCRMFFMLAYIAAFSACSFAANSTEIESQRAFNEEDLKKFCQELPRMLASMNRMEKDRFFMTTIMEYPHAVLPPSVHDDGRFSLSPQRIAYMLNHIVLAGIIEDMGGFGEGQLEFLKSQKEIVNSKEGMPADERKKILLELDDNIRHLEDLIVQTKAIPRSELVILWKEKDQLNRLLRGQIPIRKKMSEKQ